MPRILLLEDDRSLSSVLSNAIRESGHDVVQVFDGTVASKQMQAEPPDLIIADIFLPEKDGLEIIREVKRTLPKVKIIAISGGGRHDKRTYLQAATALGADISIEKPFEIEELLHSIDRLLTHDECERNPTSQAGHPEN